jgi:Zn-finger nucleic acid-binding protein
LYYRDWAERTANDKVEDESKLDADLASVSESHAALACPKCARLMSKFNISGCSKNRLDLCTSCDEAWLDGGEWELLKALQLSKRLPSIFTDAWQRKVRKEISEGKLRERFTELIGESDMKKAEEIRTWLKSHDKKVEILFYIGHE